MEDLISLGFTPCPDMNQADLEHLADLSLHYDRVRNEFLKGRITPADFLDFVETLGVHMDHYVATLTSNFQQVGIIT